MKDDQGSSSNDWVRPTWEIELIISGALIVTLFQMPQVVNSTFQNQIIHVSRDIILLPVLVFVVCKYVINALIATFVVHFFVRSFWVGILGLERAYPDGIQWEKLPLGPLFMPFYRASVMDLTRLKEQADRLASMLFSVLFIVLPSFAWLSLLGLVCVPISMLLKSLMFHSAALDDVYKGTILSLMAIIMLPGMACSIWDNRLKKSGREPSPHSRAFRLARLFMKLGFYVTLGFMTAPAILVFKTHMSKIRMVVCVVALAVFFPLTLIVDVMLISDEFKLESYVFFPHDAGEYGMSFQHYENLKQEGEKPRWPTIQSDVIRDDYLRLFLPFRAVDGNYVVREHCPDLMPFREDGLIIGERDESEDPEHVKRVLACLSGLYEVSVDDRELDLDPTFFTHPETAVRGLIAYVDVRDLSPGRHLLTVKRPKSRREREKDRDDATHHAYLISFWI